MWIVFKQETNSSSIDVLAFAKGERKAIDLTDKLAVELVRRRCGEDRANRAFEPPEHQGLYLVRAGEYELSVTERTITTTEAGWILGGSVTLKDDTVCRISTCHFDTDNLDPEGDSFMAGQCSVAPVLHAQPIRMNRPVPQPWMDELSAILRHKFKRE